MRSLLRFDLINLVYLVYLLLSLVAFKKKFMSNLQLFESKNIRSVWNEEEQKWYFSVQDVVEVLTDSLDVKQYIKRLLSRDSE